MKSEFNVELTVELTVELNPCYNIVAFTSTGDIIKTFFVNVNIMF